MKREFGKAAGKVTGKSLSAVKLQMELDKQRSWADLLENEELVRKLSLAILEEGLGHLNSPQSPFKVYHEYELRLFKETRNLPLVFLDRRFQQQGLLIQVHRLSLKEAAKACFENLRFLARARQLKEAFAVATNLASFQFVYYNQSFELQGLSGFFQLSHVFWVFEPNRNQLQPEQLQLV